VIIFGLLGYYKEVFRLEMGEVVVVGFNGLDGGLIALWVLELVDFKLVWY